MKKLLLSALPLLAAGWMQAAYAQAPAAEGDVLPQTQDRLVPQARGTGTASRIIALSLYRYNLSASAFQFSDSSTYTYSNGRGGDATTQNYDESVTFTNPGSGIVNNKKFTELFDAQNHVILYVVQNWSTANGGSWVNQSRFSYTYDANGYHTSDTSQSWSTTTSSWQNASAVAYAVNSAGKTLVANYFNWNSSTSHWDSGSQYRYTYDAANNVQELVQRNRTAGVLVNSTRNLYTYNAMGKATNLVYQSWSTATSSWVNTTGFYFVVNPHGDRDVQYNMTWSTANNRWDSTGRYLYTFDASYNQTTVVYQSNTSGSWVNSDQYNYLYNSYNQATSITTRRWNSGGFWETSTGDVQRHYYYETYTPAGIRNATASGGSMKLWPLPAHSALNLQLRWNEPQDYTATILDMQGRPCMRWSASRTATADEQIGIENLPAGSYTLVVRGSRGGAQQALFTVIR